MVCCFWWVRPKILECSPVGYSIHPLNLFAELKLQACMVCCGGLPSVRMASALKTGYVIIHAFTAFFAAHLLTIYALCNCE
jgi:hypothetical protein